MLQCTTKVCHKQRIYDHSCKKNCNCTNYTSVQKIELILAIFFGTGALWGSGSRFIEPPEPPVATSLFTLHMHRMAEER